MRHAPRFEAVGITLPAPPAEPVFLRGLVGGTWTPWFEADFAEDETPDPGREGARPGAHSQPVWLGGATAYEIDGPASVTTVQVHLVADEMHAGSVTIQSSAAGAASAPGDHRPGRLGSAATARAPPVDHRPQAGRRPPLGERQHLLRRPGACRSCGRSRRTTRTSRGWNDIAYNFAVDRFGRTWEARAGGIAEVVLGGHSAGLQHRARSVSSSSVTSPAPPVSAAAIEAVANVIAWKFALQSGGPGLDGAVHHHRVVEVRRRARP